MGTGMFEMDKEKLFQWAKQKYHTEPDYPWADENAVLRHKENNKWYALIMGVERSKLGLQGEGTVDVVNVKCEPMLIGSLLTRPGFHPAYHMNKEKWITVRLDGSVPEEEVKNLIALSYEMTAPKKKRKNE